ncbi:TolC family protein [Aquimarina algicola]|uniref:TolC family protein n=1 Tax=Aquimarina algicola TaxID=2589995 RepID=A0A504J4F5_9FLAO|nr:TolC family protein [Aquimarina algicola]TPN83465.1 TolC family protein [Aquimarina algicola]
MNNIKTETYTILSCFRRNLSLVVLITISLQYAHAQRLDGYIKYAQNNNPEIQALILNHTIASEKVNETQFIPNTEISAGYFVSEPETRTGAQEIRLSIKQMLPWFGTITARKNYAASLADAQYEDLAIAKRKLALSVAQSYYKLFAIQAQKNVLDKNIQLLQTYEQLALTSVEVGKASAVDVLRLQIRQNELIQQKEILSHNNLAEKARFNYLLHREKTMDIEVPDTLILPDKDPVLEKKKVEIHPELIKYDKLYESINTSETLNQKKSAPNLGFGLDYIAVAERPNMNFNDNGKDIIMPMVSLSIPIFNHKFKSITRQNKLKQEEISSLKEERSNRLNTILIKAINTRKSARLSIDLQLKNIEKAKNGEEIVIKNYETGTIDFNDILDIQELQLKFEMNHIESVKMYYEQSALINYLITQ